MKNDITLVSGGTDNHLALIDLRNKNVTGKELEKRLDDVCITVNKNTVPNEPLSPFIASGVRIGTAAVTTRGLNEEDMKQIALYIRMAIESFDESKDFIKNGVESICRKYPIYE